MPSEAGPAPAGLRLTADQGTRLVAGGAVLVGGSPLRVLRLTPGGARQVAAWLDGAPVPAGVAARALARRLLDAGIVHPVPAPDQPGAPAVSGVTVVIPVRDRHTELARCLDGLRGLPQVIVVDDASADPAAIREIAAARGASVIRRPVNGGPGAARNTGLRAAGTGIVAFLDSDCVPRPGWLDGLLPHFADPAVGAAAPRIVPYGEGTGWLARYEGASSTLDMGARPSVVRPRARVPYVPGAALVVRKEAAGDGFADGMYVGEDVDFVWRLAAAGWRIRYEPGAVMPHDHRVTFRAWFSRRADYGTSAAVLEELHPGAVRPLYASWWTVGAWAAVLAGRPAAGAACTAAATALLARRLSRVTGERWPIPAPVTAATPATVPAPTTIPAPTTTPAPTTRCRPDNSNKRPGWPRLRSMVVRWEHQVPPGDPPASSSLDNSIRRRPFALLRAMVEVWAPPRVPKLPPSAPPRDNSNKRGAPGMRGGAPGRRRGAPGMRGGAPGRRRGAPGNQSGALGGQSEARGRRGGAAWGLAVRLAGGGTAGAALPLGSALSRTWWPAAIPAALAVRKLRLPVAALILAPPLLDWADRRPPLDPVRYVAARLLDDAAYSVGVWQGCLARRTLRPLLPVIGARRPPA